MNTPMNTLPRKAAASFRILFYLASGLIVVLLLGMMYLTRHGEDDLPIWPRAESRKILRNAPPAPLRWGEILNPGNEIPESGFDVWYLTSGNPADITHPAHASGLNPGFNPERHTSPTWGMGVLWRDPARIIGRERDKHIAVHYRNSDFRGIPSPQFAAYWVGWLDIPQRGEYEIATRRTRSDIRILLNGQNLLEGFGEDSAVIVPLDRGRYLLEVEMANRWYTTDFALTVNQLQK